MNNNIPTVSVCCITYNQEHYIAQTIEGFLIQKTNFPIEIIIHDDASTDNTKQIVSKYAEKFPALIIPIFQTENQYSKREGSILTRFVFPRAGGKYIAVCEGDDYWTDPQKLQKQVDFLENNPEYGLVYTKVRMYNQQENAYSRNTFGKPIKSFESLFLSNSIPTATSLFRSSLLEEYYSDIFPFSTSWKMVDYPLWLSISHQSKLHLIDEITGIYRILPESASHSKKLNATLIFLNNVFDIKNFFAAKYAVQKKTIDNYTLLHYLETIFLAYKCNDHMHINSARLYFYKNNYYFLLLFLKLFDSNKKHIVPMRVINRLMNIYVNLSGMIYN